MPIKSRHIKLLVSIAALTSSALIAFSGLALAAKPAERATPVRLITREISLGKTQPGEVEYSRVISDDQKHIAFTVKTNGGEFVMVDGVAGKTYKSILRMPLTEAGVQQQINFSPDGRRVAYVAKRGEKFLVVVDGQEGPEYEGLRVGAPNFSPDSRRLAYFAERGGKTLAVIDGVESKPFETSHAIAPQFSPDSRHVVYVADHGKQMRVVVDGEETLESEYVDEPKFSKTGKRMVYTLAHENEFTVVIDGKKGKAYSGLGNNIEFSDDEQHVLYQADTPKGQVIVVDGVETEPVPIIEENSYLFSPDGQHVAFKGSLGRDSEFVVVDNQRGKTYSIVGTPAFSPDSKHVSYLALRRKFVVVTDGVEGELFDEVNDYFRFSPDGKRMAYRAKREGREFLVIDGVVKGYDKLIDFKFSPDSRRVFVAARNGNDTLVILDNQPPEKYDLAKAEASSDYLVQMAFSPDGRQTSWVAQRDGKSFVVTDGAAGKPYDEIQDLQFTSDGKHLVYAARRGGKLVVVVDGIESKEYDDIISDGSLVLDGLRTIHTLVSRGHEMLRLEIEIAE